MAIYQKRGKKISPRQMTSYRSFKREFGAEHDTETCIFTKFYAARLLIEEGYADVFVDSALIFKLQDGTVKKVMVDVCAERSGELIIVFCVTRSPTSDLFEKLRLMSKAKNAETIIICHHSIDVNELKTPFIDYFDSGRFSIRPMVWMNPELENVFKEAIELVSLLGNYTRMRMLLPLLTHSRKKRHYRHHINPKLIYENLPTLVEHRLINELTNDEYTLTRIGHEILSEYLTFLENVTRIIETAEKEVK